MYIVNHKARNDTIILSFAGIYMEHTDWSKMSNRVVAANDSIPHLNFMNKVCFKKSNSSIFDDLQIKVTSENLKM